MNKRRMYQATHLIGHALTANGHLLHCKRLTSINVVQKTALKKHIKVIQGNAMKTYWIVLLTIWTTSITTAMAIRVGEMSPCSINEWDLPLVTLLINLFPAALGFLIGKETLNGN